MESISDIGKRIYDISNPREKRRYYVFLLRSVLHRSELKRLIEFFCEDPLRKALLEKNAFPIEQATRSFFYNKSTFSERVQLVKNHYELLQKVFQDDAFMTVSEAKGNSLVIWQGTHEEQIWAAYLTFEPGQRKEGTISLELNLGDKHLYQIMFWLGYAQSGEPALWIGAMQGPNMENAKDIIKKITKACHGYRTKNLILYMLQAVARSIGIKKMYAVSNYGYYANNHVRADRKLKTNFGDFWLEAAGKETDDDRFYELPLVEPRKTMEEVPTRKRAVYRRRFEFLDSVDAEIERTVTTYLRK